MTKQDGYIEVFQRRGVTQLFILAPDGQAQKFFSQPERYGRRLEAAPRNNPVTTNHTPGDQLRIDRVKDHIVIRVRLDHFLRE